MPIYTGRRKLSLKIETEVVSNILSIYTIYIYIFVKKSFEIFLTIHNIFKQNCYMLIKIHTNNRQSRMNIEKNIAKNFLLLN